MTDWCLVSWSFRYEYSFLCDAFSFSVFVCDYVSVDCSDIEDVTVHNVMTSTSLKIWLKLGQKIPLDVIQVSRECIKTSHVARRQICFTDQSRSDIRNKNRRGERASFISGLSSLRFTRRAKESSSLISFESSVRSLDEDVCLNKSIFGDHTICSDVYFLVNDLRVW